MDPETESTVEETPSGQPQALPYAEEENQPPAQTGNGVEADALAGMEPAPDLAAPDEPDEEPQEEPPTLITMGVMDIDKKLGGGLPLETITLVEGDPESGKSVVVEQLAYNA
ncbi:MAG TPA: hypothetical protein VLS25_13340, partial [Dehalococcoidia bacterium]|nr:hypothetical protein [Dehalococcoidia bacterium]